LEKDWNFLGDDFNLPHLLVSLLPGARNLEVTTRALKEYIGLSLYWMLDI